MSRKSVLESSASALAQADVGASGIHPSVIASALGDSASTEALDRLNRAAQETKNVENAKALARAIRARGRIDPVVVNAASDLVDVLPDVLQDGDLLLMMGAGDIGHAAQQLAKDGFAEKAR